MDPFFDDHCVRVIGRKSAGSGFFVSEDHILTAAHVVHDLSVGEAVTVKYKTRQLDAVLVAKVPDGSNEASVFPDIALLQTEPVGKPLTFDYDPLQSYDDCLSYGFPSNGYGGEQKTLVIEGKRNLQDGSIEHQMSFRESQIVNGLSGSPVVRRSTSGVVGILVKSKNVTNDFGGFLNPISFLVDALPVLKDWHPRDVQINVSSVTASERSTDPLGPATRTLLRSLDQYGLELETLTIEKQDRIKKDIDRGSQVVTYDEVLKEIGDNRFSLLPDRLKALYYRFAAVLSLSLNKPIQVAEEFAAKAFEHGLDQGDLQLRVRLELYKNGPAAARLLVTGHSAEDVILRAGLDIAAGDASTAVLSASAILDGNKKNAELHRILAIGYLSTQRPLEAQKFATDAVALAPDNLQTKITAASVAYYQARPAITIPPDVSLLPFPLPDEYLKLDKAALDALSQASQKFSECLAALNATDPFRPVIEVWKLAALSDDPRRGEEAAAYARSLLYRDVPNDDAMDWIILRDLKVDLEAWEAKRRNDLQDLDAHEGLQTVLGRLETYRGNFAEAVTMLLLATENEAERFRIPRKATLVQAYGALKEYDKAIEVTDSEEGNVFAGLKKAIKSSQLLRDDPKARMEPDGPFALLTECENFARSGKWDLVAGKKDQLLRVLPCAASVNVVLAALSNLHRFDDFLAVVDEFSWVQETDERITRSKIGALWNTGWHIEALQTAANLFERHPTAENGNVFGRLLFATSDYEKLAVLSRSIKNAEGLTAEVALRFAAWLQDSHPSDAGDLFDRAQEIGIDDSLVQLALSVAYKSGRETKTEQLVTRMAKLSESGSYGMKTGTYKDLVELVETRAQSERHFNDSYTSGMLPIQIFCDMMNMPLYTSHCWYPRANSTNPIAKRTSIFVRHGGREALTAIPREAHLVLDVTAILTLWQLNLLPSIEKSFEKIRVASNLSGSLFDMRDTISSPQPARIETIRQTIAACDQGIVRVEKVEDKFKWIEEMDAQYVTGLPPIDFKTGQPIGLSAAVTARLLNARRLIEDLKASARIGEWKAAAALELFGTQGKEEAIGPALQPGALLIDAAILETLVESSLVAAIIDAGNTIVIDSDELVFLKAQIAEAQVRSDTSEDIKALIAHVRNRIEDKVYEIGPEVELGNATGSITMKSLLQALQMAESNDIVVIDDRFTNRMSKTEKRALVVSSFDLLASLFKHGILSKEEYYRVLIQARDGALMFIPISAEELSYHLERASIVDGKLKESAELRSIRYYLSLVFKQPGLQLLTTAENETPYIVMLKVAFETILRKEPKTQDEASRREYLLESMMAADISAIQFSPLVDVATENAARFEKIRARLQMTT